MRCIFIAVLFLAVSLHAVHAQAGQSPDAAPPLSVSVLTNVAIALSSDTDLFRTGGGMALDVVYRIPSTPLFSIGGSLAYTLLPLASVTTLSLVDGVVSLGLNLDAGRNVSLRWEASGGLSLGVLNNGVGNGVTPLAASLVSAAWKIRSNPKLPFDVRLGAAYRWYVGLYHPIIVFAGASYWPPRRQKDGGLQIEGPYFDDVFPALHAYYDTHPLGYVIIRNANTKPLQEVTLSLIVPQYMDAPKDFAVIPFLAPGEERRIDLLALFKNTILETKQSTRVSGELRISYRYEGITAMVRRVTTLHILDRNAITWDDTGKAAALVMPKEPAVLAISNRIASFVKDSMPEVFDRNLQTAIAIHDALRLLGVAYVSPPLTSYATTSRTITVIDSVKFPLETIRHGAGDCSDLSVLYCSLLESLQIETAFVTVPGHLFFAFALESSEAQVRSMFGETGEFIIRDDTVWVPVEVTMRDATFLASWQVGAELRRNSFARGEAGFYPVREAWRTFEPVNFPGTGDELLLPEPATVVRTFRAEIDELTERSISWREADLKAEIDKAGGGARRYNALGVLYSQFGRLDDATAQFQTALRDGAYAPALVNLGNVALLKGDAKGALEFYERASMEDPGNPLVLLGIAQAHYELGDIGAAQTAYRDMKAIRPDLAARYQYLEMRSSVATRSAEAAATRRRVEWFEQR